MIFSLANMEIQISDDTGERCSFEEIRIKTIRVAQHLQKQGYKREQVIGIEWQAMCLNRPHLFLSSTNSYVPLDTWLIIHLHQNWEHTPCIYD